MLRELDSEEMGLCRWSVNPEDFIVAYILCVAILNDLDIYPLGSNFTCFPHTQHGDVMDYIVAPTTLMLVYVSSLLSLKLISIAEFMNTYPSQWNLTTLVVRFNRIHIAHLWYTFVRKKMEYTWEMSTNSSVERFPNDLWQRWNNLELRLHLFHVQITFRFMPRNSCYNDDDDDDDDDECREMKT